MVTASSFLNVLLPPLCAGCRKESSLPTAGGFFICDTCKDSIDIQNYFTCPACKRRDPQGRLDRKCRSEAGLTRFLGTPLSYENERVRKIIHAFKYQHARALAEPLAEIMVRFLMSSPDVHRGRTILTPIPMVNFKERERDFNQAAEIAKLVAAHYKLNLQERLLLKVKNTSNQADIKNKESRIRNLEGAFACVEPDAVRGKIVVLVDDVYTTGSTMRECARVLRKAGAREVWGMAVARG